MKTTETTCRDCRYWWAWYQIAPRKDNAARWDDGYGVCENEASPAFDGWTKQDEGCEAGARDENEKSAEGHEEEE